MRKLTILYRNAFLLLAVVIINSQAFSQISISGDDMPVPGDTVRRSISLLIDGIDFGQTGPDHYWDFSNLTPIAQQQDTFVSVSQTPAIYQIFFNNQFLYPHHKASVALKLSQFNSIPALQVTDVYQFLKNADNEFREVGYGITIAGVPLPLQYQQIDTLYRFPLLFGNTDSSHSSFEVGVPDLGFLQIIKFRKNTVDGWGILITPFGQFQTLRVKTEIQEYDSIYIDSLNIGVPLNREYTEYKWLANGYPEPLVQVTVEGLAITASYVDSVRNIFLEVPEQLQRKFDYAVYPNPCNDYLSVSYELFKASHVRISIYSVYGNELKRFASFRQERGLYNRVLYLKESGFNAGIYLLQLTIDNVSYIKRILLN